MTLPAKDWDVDTFMTGLYKSVHKAKTRTKDIIFFIASPIIIYENF